MLDSVTEFSRGKLHSHLPKIALHRLQCGVRADASPVDLARYRMAIEPKKEAHTAWGGSHFTLWEGQLLNINRRKIVHRRASAAAVSWRLTI
jgi:hypothetical protein